MRSSTGNREGNALEVVHPHAAGIDIGSREHYVAVGPDVTGSSVRTFGCATADVFEMGRWLKECGVTTVAMESTGVYWVPVARILEGEFGIPVVLVDPRYVRSVPGRKTDVKDASGCSGFTRTACSRASFEALSRSSLSRRTTGIVSRSWRGARSTCFGCRKLSRS